jgi:hypothetical protein
VGSRPIALILACSNSVGARFPHLPLAVGNSRSRFLAFSSSQFMISLYLSCESVHARALCRILVLFFFLLFRSRGDVQSVARSALTRCRAPPVFVRRSVPSAQCMHLRSSSPMTERTALVPHFRLMRSCAHLASCSKRPASPLSLQLCRCGARFTFSALAPLRALLFRVSCVFALFALNPSPRTSHFVFS